MNKKNLIVFFNYSIKNTDVTQNPAGEIMYVCHEIYRNLQRRRI